MDQVHTTSNIIWEINPQKKRKKIYVIPATSFISSYRKWIMFLTDMTPFRCSESVIPFGQNRCINFELSYRSFGLCRLLQESSATTVHDNKWPWCSKGRTSKSSSSGLQIPPPVDFEVLLLWSSKVFSCGPQRPYPMDFEVLFVDFDGLLRISKFSFGLRSPIPADFEDLVWILKFSCGLKVFFPLISEVSSCGFRSSPADFDGPSGNGEASKLRRTICWW